MSDEIYEGYILSNVHLGTHDGRLRAYLVNKKENKTYVMSYPKYLMEKHLNRYLEDDESVDHIDGDPLNNSLDNLRVLKNSVHFSFCAKYIVKDDNYEYICPMCKKVFTLTKKQIIKRYRNYKNRPNSRGPFCSNSCSSKYSTTIKNKDIEKEKDCKTNINVEEKCKSSLEHKNYISSFCFLDNKDTKNKIYLNKLCEEYFGKENIIFNDYYNLFKCNIFIKPIDFAIFWDNSCFYDFDYKLKSLREIYEEIKKIKLKEYNFLILHEFNYFDSRYFINKLKKSLIKFDFYDENKLNESIFNTNKYFESKYGNSIKYIKETTTNLDNKRNKKEIRKLGYVEKIKNMGFDLPEDFYLNSSKIVYDKYKELKNIYNKNKKQ